MSEQRPVRQARFRRAPRYDAFIVTGLVLGFVLGLLTGLSGNEVPGFDRAKLVGYLAVGLGLLGGLLGGLAAILVERFGSRGR